MRRLRRHEAAEWMRHDARPPLRAARMAALVVSSRAAQSMAQSTPRLAVSAWIWPGGIDLIQVDRGIAHGERGRGGPRVRRRMRPAPATFRQAMVRSPMGPAPGRRRFRRTRRTSGSAWRRRVSSTMVASSSDRSGGMPNRFATGRLTVSRKKPGVPGLLKRCWRRYCAGRAAELAVKPVERGFESARSPAYHPVTPAGF